MQQDSKAFEGTSNQIISRIFNPATDNYPMNKNTIFSTSVPPSETDLREYISGNNQHSNFIYVYFWFAYHLLLSPFRLKKGANGRYEIHRWFPQKVLCGFLLSLSLLRLVTTLRTSIENLRTNDPVSFFNMFCETSSFIFKCTMLIGFWRKGEARVTLANFVSSFDFIQYNPYKLESIKTLTVLCSSYTILSLLRFIMGSGFLRVRDWSIIWWCRRTVAEAHYTFFLVADRNLGTAPELSLITPFDTFLAVIQGLSGLHRFLVGFFVDLCILMHVLVLWAPATAFTNEMYKKASIITGNKIERHKLFKDGVGAVMKEELESVIRQFEALKNLSILVGEAVGDSLLPYIAEALFYYARYFDDVLLTTDIVRRLVLSFFYLSAVCIFMFSAEITRQMRWFKVWLCEDVRLALIDQNKLGMLLDDFSNDSVGITASGIFTINYAFVGTIVSVLITYFIIRLQSMPSNK